MQSRHAEEVANLKRSVLGGPGTTDPALRMAAFSGKDVPEDWAKYEGQTSDSGPASRSALEDALYVGFLFNTVNRLANALAFQWTDENDRMRLAGALNRVRYHAPAFLLR